MNLLPARSWEPVAVIGRASYSRTLQSAKPLKRNEETYSLYVEGTWDDPMMPESAPSWRAPRTRTPRRRQVLVRTRLPSAICRLPSAVCRLPSVVPCGPLPAPASALDITGRTRTCAV
jgi:hypothetical protein